ncbi:hypothetical protein ABT263_36100 [Kitasatospora sp. NPDC001603]|uniref:hypothetical protein n=1 Tax=Kitasatospora sp. NPDC001603 TaxID=3154388 RepID=UPI00332D6BE1
MTGMTSGEGRSRRQDGTGTDDDSDSGIAFLTGFFALGKGGPCCQTSTTAGIYRPAATG